VVSEYQDAVADVFVRRAEEMGSALIFAAQKYSAKFLQRDPEGQEVEVEALLADGDRASDAEVYRLDLQGSYQSKNHLGILSAVDVLRNVGWDIPGDAVHEALVNVQRL